MIMKTKDCIIDLDDKELQYIAAPKTLDITQCR